MALPRLTGKHDASEAVKSKGPGGGLKMLVIMLIVMDVLAAGAYGYLKLVRAKDVEKTRATAKRNLIRLKLRGEQVAQAVVQLSRASSEDVSDPTTPIQKAAQGMAVGDQGQNMTDFVTIGTPVNRRFARSDIFESWTTDVKFREKNGYKFEDLVQFLKLIESKNSKVQIAAMNFGKRDDTVESWWRPIKMDVRVFKPVR